MKYSPEEILSQLDKTADGEYITPQTELWHNEADLQRISDLEFHIVGLQEKVNAQDQLIKEHVEQNRELHEELHDKRAKDFRTYDLASWGLTEKVSLRFLKRFEHSVGNHALVLELRTSKVAVEQLITRNEPLPLEQVFIKALLKLVEVHSEA